MSSQTMTTTATQAAGQAPAPGQLVEVRRRQWIVSEVDAAAVAPELPKRNLVRLASIDEDALGEEIEVLWELEPGAHVIERAGLPALTGVDEPQELDAFLDAVRWGAATNADRAYLQAPFRSGVSIEDYQLDPLVRAIDMARTNLLIADDVGLGKTIEAGLVLQEMLLRHRARTVLVLCPSSLQDKWRNEMSEKFGLEFQIVDTEYVKQLRRKRGLHANPWTSFPRLITSMDWAKQGEGVRLLRDVLPPRPTFPRKFDLLIIDEAHNVAPTVGAYAVESLRTRLARQLAPHFQHKLFVTATPHDGNTQSFMALLELLDDQRFSRSMEVPPPEHLARVMVRRLKSDLVDAEGKKIFPVRRLELLKIAYSSDERAMRGKLDEFIALREAGREAGDAASRFVHEILRKRLSSSPAAFASTLECHVATVGGERRDTRPKSGLDDKILRRAIARTDDDYDDDGARETAVGDAVVEASRRQRPFNPEERRFLDQLRSWAQQAAQRPDAKANAILAWLGNHVRPNGQWSDVRVILFTEYRTTQNWLHQILASNGYGGDRLALMFGGMDPKEREGVKAAFQADPRQSPVRVLLATDAASEGIDLQSHCSLMIHVEIPYNPNVMEQRNGRIDRHGQKQAEVVIWHPVDSMGNYGEDILRALKRLDSMRADMGSVNPVIAPQLPQLIEGRRRELDTRGADQRIERARRHVKIERDLRERVAKLHAQLATTKLEQHLLPTNVEQAVRTALKLAQKPGLEQVRLARAQHGRIFRMPALAGSWARCLDGLQHPFTRAVRPITFDHEVAGGHDDVVLVHLNHPLVQMSLRLLRAEVWARDDVKKLHRVAVRSLPDSVLEGPAVITVARLVITGGNHHRLHEELIEAGGHMKDASFRRVDKVGEVRGWLDSSMPATIPASVFGALKERYDKQGAAILGGVEARAKERLRGLGGTIEARRRREKDDIAQVLGDLEKNLKAELAAEFGAQQLLPFTPEELNQVRRDRIALEARLHRIPEELKRELEAIDARHAKVAEHVFPVAVFLVVPESLLHGRKP